MILLASAGIMALLSIVFIYLGLRNKVVSIDDYITYRGKSGMALTAYSLTASTLGVWILFTPAETGSSNGITGLISYSLGCSMPLFLLAFFGPKLMAQLPMGYGFGDYVKTRFGTKTSNFVSVVMLFVMGASLTAELATIGQALSLTMKLPILLSCAIVMALVFAYVFRGGLGASIITDKIQFYVFVPLLIILGISVFRVLGREGSLVEQINLSSPKLLSLSLLPDWKFGAVLFVGITCSTLFLQGFWQRVYSMNQNQSMKMAFLWGGIMVIPIILLAGFFGIFAKIAGTLNPEEASLAIFSLLPILSPFFTVLLVVLAFVLVLCSTDTLLNGIVSIIMSWRLSSAKKADPSAQDNGDDAGSLRIAKGLTILVGILAVYFGSRRISILYLFLIANLVCSAFAFPLVYGLFNKKITGLQAVLASSAGLTLGALFFPLADYVSSWSGLPADMFISFLTALLVSTLLSLLFAGISSRSHQ